MKPYEHDKRDLAKRLEAEEAIHREGSQSKGPYVQRTPEQCGRTADLLKEVVDERKKPQNMGEPSAYMGWA